ncbi:hypothetical protein Taro_029634 [Colocasia esculenta]|uniref:RNase H type-1 domain-containing protein n=1 Tax=Colocasia esculenta TaxID=4460 RepID=A0A843VTT4_COLES|nr:hypothetical protein [Colocasia esculenta]
MKSGEAGGGGILRDYNGDMQWAFSIPYYDLKTSQAAEAHALRDGLRLCCKMDASEVQVETVSLNHVHIVTKQTPRPWDLSFILQEIVVTAAKVKAEIIHVSREGNKVADCHAEFTVSCVCFTLLDRWADLPSNVMDSCFHDKARHPPMSPESILEKAFLSGDPGVERGSTGELVAEHWSGVSIWSLVLGDPSHAREFPCDFTRVDACRWCSAYVFSLVLMPALRDTVLTTSAAQTCADFPSAFLNRVTRLHTVFAVALSAGYENLGFPFLARSLRDVKGMLLAVVLSFIRIHGSVEPRWVQTSEVAMQVAYTTIATSLSGFHNGACQFLDGLLASPFSLPHSALVPETHREVRHWATARSGCGKSQRLANWSCGRWVLLLAACGSGLVALVVTEFLMLFLRCLMQTHDCCFYNPFLGAILGGTGVCSSLTSWRVRGSGWFCLWALNLEECSESFLSRWVCADGCFRIVFDSASSAVPTALTVGVFARAKQMLVCRVAPLVERCYTCLWLLSAFCWLVVNYGELLPEFFSVGSGGRSGVYCPFGWLSRHPWRMRSLCYGVVPSFGFTFNVFRVSIVVCHVLAVASCAEPFSGVLRLTSAFFFVSLVHAAPVELSISDCDLRAIWGALCELSDVWFGTLFMAGSCVPGRRVKVGNAMPRPVAFWGPKAKSLWPVPLFPFLSFSIAFSSLRGKAFLSGDPSVELGGAGELVAEWSLVLYDPSRAREFPCDFARVDACRWCFIYVFSLVLIVCGRGEVVSYRDTRQKATCNLLRSGGDRLAVAFPSALQFLFPIVVEHGSCPSCLLMLNVTGRYIAFRSEGGTLESRPGGDRLVVAFLFRRRRPCGRVLVACVSGRGLCLGWLTVHLGFPGRCNKPGHMKGESLENKKEKYKKIHKFKKPKAMVATWSDEDSSEKEEEKSSSSESEEICFMANS